MSKAYCCDNCRECYPGFPAATDSQGNDICPNCVRVMRALSVIDPFDDVIYFYDREGDQ